MRRTLAGLMSIALLISACSSNGSAEWSDEIVLDAQGASVPTTAVHETTGRVHWAWFGEDEQERPTVFASFLDPEAQQPSDRVRVSPPEVSVNAHRQAPAQIAVSDDSTIYVAWSTHIEVEGRRFPASNLQLAQSTDGGRSFQAPVFVNEDHDGPPAGHTFHDLAVGPDGTVYVSWLDSRESSQSAHSASGHAATSTNVRIARSSDGGRTFGPSVVVARGSCQCCRTALHVDEHGTVYLAWRHLFGENTRDIALARSEDGGLTFTAPVRVHQDQWDIDGCPHAGPAVATDTAGAVHVGWYTAAPGRIGLHHAVSNDHGQSFSDPQPLVTDVPISQLDLVPADAGAWLLWEDRATGEVCIRKSGDSGSPTRTFDGVSPAVSHAAGRTAIAWERDGRVLAALLH